MTEQDILVISQLVDFYTNNTDFSKSRIDNQNENIHKDKDKGNSISSRSEYWKLLINELKRYGDIKVAIKEQQENHEKLQKEVNYLNKQKQEITNSLQIVTFFINEINSKISYFNEFMDHYKELNNKINLSSRFSHPFIIIIYKDAGKDDDNENKENKNE